MSYILIESALRFISTDPNVKILSSMVVFVSALNLHHLHCHQLCQVDVPNGFGIGRDEELVVVVDESVEPEMNMVTKTTLQWSKATYQSPSAAFSEG